jgi:hypothetical protein
MNRSSISGIDKHRLLGPPRSPSHGGNSGADRVRFILFWVGLPTDCHGGSCLGWGGWSVKLATHLNLLPMLGMSGVYLCFAMCLHVVDRAIERDKQLHPQTVLLSESDRTHRGVARRCCRTVRGSRNCSLSVLDKALNFYTRCKPVSIVDVR